MAPPAMSAEILYAEETVTVAGEEIDLIRTADNFIVLFDTSSSMGAPYKDTGLTKLDAAKQVLRKYVEQLPELNWKAGLYSYAPTGGLVGILKSDFDLPFYEMAPFDSAGFVQSIDNLPAKAGGPTLLQHALHRLDSILAGLEGRTMVFIFTDGRFTHDSLMESPIAQAKALVAKYDVGFTIISSAEGEQEQDILNAVAKLGAGSKVISFDQLYRLPVHFGGALYVIHEEIFATTETYEKIVGVEFDNTLFDFDEATINPQNTGELDEVGKLLADNPEAVIMISGFTDSVGSQEYNLALSMARATSVGDYLEEKFSISKDRMALFGYGEANPIADNATKEGRSRNRRVRAIVAGM